MTTVVISPVEDLPEVTDGDDLAHLMSNRLDGPLRDYDLVVVTSKIVSKAAGLISVTDREALIDDATDRVVARRGSTRIVRTHTGLTMAAAGLDASNTKPGTVVSLPPDPDADAARLRSDLMALHPSAEHLGVVITDTAGRAWRVGQTDIAIGCAGISPTRSYAGTFDTYGNELRVTLPAVADEVAAAAELATGKMSGCPAAIVRGIDPSSFCSGDGPGARSLIRAEDEDLFGLGALEAVSQAVGASSGRPRGFADVGEDPIETALAGVNPAVLSVETGASPRSTTSIDVSPAQGADHDEVLLEVGALKERVRILDRAYGTRHEVRVHGLYR